MEAPNPNPQTKAQTQTSQSRRSGIAMEPQSSFETQLVPNNSLITDTPEEGRALAIKMARLVVSATQPDENVRKRLRDVYANDAAMLIEITHVTAIEFQTVAAANNYWRKEN
jgi:hypothetical protein